MFEKVLLGYGKRLAYFAMGIDLQKGGLVLYIVML